MEERNNNYAEENQKIINDLLEALEEAAAENDFLSQTIVNNNIGAITEERRKLLAETKDAKENANKEIIKAEKIREEYDAKLKEINKLLKEVNTKTEEINKYIDSEVSKRIKNDKNKLLKPYIIKEQKYKKRFIILIIVNAILLLSFLMLLHAGYVSVL